MYGTIDVIERADKGDWKLRVIFAHPMPTGRARMPADRVIDLRGALFETEEGALAAADQARAAFNTLGIELRGKVAA